jgi:hypothetical protein
MVKVNINGSIYEAPNIIQIKNGCLIIESENIGIIGYECCVQTIEGVVTHDGETITWKSN